MISREATSYDEQQKISTPPESPMTTVTDEHPSNLTCSEQTPSDPCPRSAAGQKQKRSPSPLETQRKRPSSPIETAHDGNNLQPLPSQNEWHCSNCGFPCRLCLLSSESRLDLSVLHDNPISEHESMNPPSTPTSTSSARSNKRKKCEGNGIRFIGPKDAEFETAILNPCGAYLDGTGKPSNMTVEDVFGPQSTKISSRVLIHKDKKALQGITEDFGQYIKGHYDEHTLTLICTDSIVLRDRYVYNDLKDNNNFIRAIRRDKWKPGKKGPPNPGLLYTYDWDIEPATTYAVSIRMFDAKDRRTLKTVEWQRWLAEENAACPYLTIEATQRIKRRAASAIWLYQRKQICDALEASLDDLRHYTIVIFDAQSTISEARIEESRYDTRTLAVGSLTDMASLENYIRWSNAIHVWGLGVNATSFKRDIQTLLTKASSPMP
ncbi:hypothetical protein MMC22_011798 [Lobaria immixta]|nr:hypothetical protein [Lobaria immixta]